MKTLAILASDIHLMKKIPKCRTDQNYLKLQFNKLNSIFDLAIQHNCYVIIAGDLGEDPEWPDWMEEKFLSMRNEWPFIYVVAGQHDLPGHDINRWKEGALGVLHAAKVIDVIWQPTLVENKSFAIYPFPYGTEIKPPDVYDIVPDVPLIAVSHQLVIEDDIEWPNQKAVRANKLLTDFSEYDIILIGDNHKSFKLEYDNSHLVNPGSMTRHKADQVNHEPRVYIWKKHMSFNIIETHFLDIEKGVITRDHINTEEKKEKEQRYEALIQRLKTDSDDIELDFKSNCEDYFRKHRTEDPIKNKIFGWFDRAM